jgi:hypothetical protein
MIYRVSIQDESPELMNAMSSSIFPDDKLKNRINLIETGYSHSHDRSNSGWWVRKKTKAHYR